MFWQPALCTGPGARKLRTSGRQQSRRRKRAEWGGRLKGTRRGERGGVENRMVGGGGGWGNPTESQELFWGSQSSLGSRKRTTSKGKGTFFFPSREFYLGAENSRNADRAGAFGGGLEALPCHSPRMDFVSIRRRPNLEKTAAGAPGRRGGSGSWWSPGREAGLGPARLRVAWLSLGRTRRPWVTVSTLDSESSDPSSSFSGPFTFRPRPVSFTRAARSFEGRVLDPVRLPLQPAGLCSNKTPLTKKAMTLSFYS